MVNARLSTQDSDPVAPALGRQAPTADLPERPIDLWLLGAIFALLCVGTVAIYSATAPLAFSDGGDSAYYLKRQIVFLLVGGGALWVGTRFDVRTLARWAYPLLLVALVLLAAVLAMPARNGASRWFPLGSFSFQPVEIAKLALITYLSYSLARKADKVKAFTIGFVPHLVVCGLFMLLLLKQPDLGSTVVLGATTLGMLFVAGARVSYIMLAVLAAAPIVYTLVVGTPWRMQRFLAYFNPEAFASQEAYQYLQSRIAIGSGGLTGRGLGDGQQMLGYLPEAHNDFVLAPIGEEMGFLGVALVFALFAILLWRGLRAAFGARDAFSGYLAFGITLVLTTQALFNASVVLGVVPNKGITLPLVSYGGSSLVVTMFLCGVLLGIGMRRRHVGAQLQSYSFARRKRERVTVVVA